MADIRIPLDEMTVEEKLHAMEILWDDLCRRAGAIPEPQWHREVLAGREAALARGEDQVEDWEAAKARIEREIR